MFTPCGRNHDERMTGVAMTTVGAAYRPDVSRLVFDNHVTEQAAAAGGAGFY